MRARLLWLPVALAAGAASAVIPSLAAGQSAPSSASFMAVDGSGGYGGGASHSWVSSGGGNQATIAQGGTVNFSYSTANASTPPTMHNADFDSGPATPSCTQTQGSPNGAVPPLPHSPQGPDWAGNCKFTVPGTYTFHCDLHGPSMSGTIVVQSSGSGGTNPTTPPPSTPPSTATPAPLAQSGLSVVSHGRRTVSGDVTIGTTGSRLQADLVPATASGARVAATRVLGRTIEPSVASGSHRFQVALNRRGRRMLARRRRLRLALRVTVTPPGGSASTASVPVTLRGR